jgi:hypothetical protein
MKQNYCPCGGIILADTEEWRLPRCYSCWEKMGSPAIEPALSQASDDGSGRFRDPSLEEVQEKKDVKYKTQTVIEYTDEQLYRQFVQDFFDRTDTLPNDHDGFMAGIQHGRLSAHLKSEGVHTCHSECPRPLCVLGRQLEQERQRSAKLVEALKFYANPETWESTTHDSTRDGCGCMDFSSYMNPFQGPVQVGGKRAREAIAEFERGVNEEK